MSPSNSYSSVVAALRELMSPYFSAINLDAVIRHGVQRAGASPGSELQPKQIEQLVEEAMIAGRMFVSGNDLAQLMVDLAEFVAAQTAID